ncbi:MAG: TIGR00299 family protein [Bacteroidetes bacterium 4572_114]|nr:MAG: TIGR00299 family protein [Bacteroidetes bacterium 4572_114]
MKVLYYDCFSGISGDMNLAALVDLGVPGDFLINELKKLNLTGYTIEITSDERNSIFGAKVKINLDDDKGEGQHRHLSDIVSIIKSSKLNDTVKNKSLEMFQKLAEAEAKVHGMDIKKVHFHEVGAIDSILDIVGAAICLDYFKPEKILSSSIELGSGMVKCAHGIFPVPAPATSEILTSIPVKTGNQPFEATTPTGAVILACNVDEFTNQENFLTIKTGYGIGHKKSDVPNVLRVFGGELAGTKEQKMLHTMFECNIDDMNPEILEYVMNRLFKAGADDVFITPIIMKKSRNGSKLSVLCQDSIKEIVTEILISETSTFGFRSYPVNKTELVRDFIERETKYGKARVKRAFQNGEVVKQKPEYEDCVRLAEENNVPVKEVYLEFYCPKDKI